MKQTFGKFTSKQMFGRNINDYVPKCPFLSSAYTILLTWNAFIFLMAYLSNSTYPLAQIPFPLRSLTLSISSEILFLLNSYSNVYLNNPFDNHPSTCKISLIAFFKMFCSQVCHMCVFSPLLDCTLFKGRVYFLECVTASRMPTVAGSRVSLNLWSWSVAACYEGGNRKPLGYVGPWCILSHFHSFNSK